MRHHQPHPALAVKEQQIILDIMLVSHSHDRGDILAQVGKAFSFGCAEQDQAGQREGIQQLLRLRFSADFVQGFDEGDLIAEPFQSPVDAFQHHVVKGVAILVDARDEQDANGSALPLA